MRISKVTIVLSALALSTAVWADDHQTSGQVSSNYDSDQNPGQVSSDTYYPNLGIDNGRPYQSSANESFDTSSESNGSVNQSAGSVDEANLATTAEASEVTRGYLSKEVVGLKPQVGVMAFSDQNGNTTARAAYGATIETNIAAMIGYGGTPLYIGPETGLIYSHLGDTSSNFFGSNTGTNVGNSGANIYLIPANLKLGWNVTDRFRLAVHGGGNVMYRSVASAVNTGASSGQSGSVWRIYPNAGGDVEYAVGQNFAVMLRPDVTVTPGNTLFTGTLAASIAIG